MSNLSCQNEGMRIEKRCRIFKTDRFWPVPYETIATFGTVRLVRRADGRHELIGGTAIAQSTAQEWCSQFTPFVVFGEARLFVNDIGGTSDGHWAIRR